MQQILMTEMLHATAEFKPNGQPSDRSRVHRMALLRKQDEDAQTRKPGSSSRTTLATWLNVLFRKTRHFSRSMRSPEPKQLAPGSFRRSA